MQPLGDDIQLCKSCDIGYWRGAYFTFASIQDFAVRVQQYFKLGDYAEGGHDAATGGA
jgi:hypothetical protein